MNIPEGMKVKYANSIDDIAEAASTIDFRPNRPHPLFRGFLEAVARRAGQLPASAATVEETSRRR